jgi:hypothetical protein
MNAIQPDMDGKVDTGDAAAKQSADACPLPTSCFEEEHGNEDVPQNEMAKTIVPTPVPEKAKEHAEDVKLRAKRGRGQWHFMRRLLESSDTSDSEDCIESEDINSIRSDHELPRNEETTSRRPAKLAKTTGQARNRAVERALNAHAKHNRWLEDIPSAPVYTPSLEEWQRNPLEYIKSIEREASQAGICLIKPPVTPVIPPGLVLGKKQFSTRQQRIRNLKWNSNWQSDAKFFERDRPYHLKEFKEDADEFAAKRLGIPGLLPTRSIESQYWAERDPEGRSSSAVSQTYVEYGNDVEGSAFSVDDPTFGNSFWNLNKLPMSEGSPLCELHSTIPGVSTPMLYIGMLFSTFAWHVEDHCLYSINYQHAGASKVWYGVPSSAADAFESALMKTAYSAPCQAMKDGGEDDQTVHNRAKAELMDKNTMISPFQLQRFEVPVFRVVQEAGTFVVTFPRAYHSGFSCGFNVGEAVNFGCDNWWQFAESASDLYCHLKRPHIIPQDEILYKLIMNNMEQGQALTFLKNPVAVDVFLRTIGRLRHLRQKLTGRGAYTVLAKCENNEMGSVECGICLSPCFFCSTVVNLRKSPDEWQHLCLKCADKETEKSISINAPSAEEDGGKTLKNGIRSLIFVKPCWRAAESAAIELREILGSPMHDKWIPLPNPHENLPEWVQASKKAPSPSPLSRKQNVAVSGAGAIPKAVLTSQKMLDHSVASTSDLPAATIVQTDQLTLTDGRVVQRRIFSVNGKLAVAGGDLIHAVFPGRTMRQMPSSGGWIEQCFRRVKHNNLFEGEVRVLEDGCDPRRGCKGVAE